MSGPRAGFVLAACVAWWPAACAWSPTHDPSLPIPSLEEWTDCGPVIAAGEPGDWDHILWGGFAASALKKDGVFLLYYQGSNGYDEQGETVTHRTIGVALSSDGVHFEKYHENPLITFSPTGNPEEGAASSAVVLEETGDITLYYGANTWVGGDRVSADARYSQSRDGLRFADRGTVFAHDDSGVWGGGDEVFPLVAFEHEDKHFVYYVPNGTLQTGRLGLARVDSSGQWGTSPVVQGWGGRGVEVWGPGSAVEVGNGVFAVFFGHNRPNTGYMDVWTVNVADPARFSRPIRRYEWENVTPRSVLHDPDDGSWYLYYRNTEPDRYGVMVARRDCVQPS